MGFGEAIKSVLSQYANFNGRARRSELWWWVLGFFLVYFATAILAGLLSAIHESLGIVGMLLYAVVLLGGLVPNLAVTVRRLHDTDKSGWFILLGFIPLVGGIILLVFYCMEGTPGPNQYGPDPKNPHGGGYQPYPGQPYQGQPYPGQPYPGQQPQYGQPYPGQPQPGQPQQYPYA
ncbi:DUF805 domain-containing protein [Nocardia sp. 2]|uniref:DUF805 domain-containing protein n=1 Tax=Nocardia acididurans TaxID=2802282 RepID=A0ABS1LZ52_9NOCA|nr:DUF805 domain-containing protein [Nocardia acididurans]MBL1073326.1 DUF805 domain-containing protein [Nocardia acididurans]